MKDTFYFSHDYNAASDEKIIKLLSRHGMEGYGTFWRIVESLYNNQNDMKADYDRIAYELHVNSTVIIKSVIEDFDLFIIKEGYFGSESIEKRLKERNEKSEKARQSALRRWNRQDKTEHDSAFASLNDANALKNDANALKSNAELQKTDAIKERKEKDIKETKDINENADGKPVIVSEIITYLNEKTGKHFRPNIKKTIELICARLKEGRVKDDFIRVINNKVTDWKGDPKMDKFLRPETLFGNKFESYLNEHFISKKISNNPSSKEIEFEDHTKTLSYGAN